MSRLGSNFIGLVDSDSDDDLTLRFGAKNRAATTMAPAKRGRAATANKVTKPAQKAGRRTSDRVAAALEQPAGRKALMDRTNEQAIAPVKTGAKAAVTMAQPPASDVAKQKAPRGRPRANKAKVQEIPDSQPAEVEAKSRRGRKATAAKDHDQEEAEDATLEIPETQPADVMDVDISEDTPIEEISVMPPPVAMASSPRKAAASTASFRRAGTAGDNEANEPSLRRRIGELTKKCESLESKYRDLRQIGVKDAEHNFDKLRKQAEEKTKCTHPTLFEAKSRQLTCRQHLTN
jgi:hypothetical protein